MSGCAGISRQNGKPTSSLHQRGRAEADRERESEREKETDVSVFPALVLMNNTGRCKADGGIKKHLAVPSFSPFRPSVAPVTSAVVN